MAKRVFILFLVMWILAAPVLAVDNTIGVVHQDLEFCGFSVGTVGSNIEYHSTANNVVNKFYTNTPDLIIQNSAINFYFRWPALADELFFDGSLGVSSSSWTMGSPAHFDIYGLKRIGYNNFESVLLDDNATVSLTATDDNFAFKFTKRHSYTNQNFYYLVISAPVKKCIIDSSLTFSESSSLSGSYSGLTDYSGTYFFPSTYKLKASINLTDNTSQPLFQYYDSYMTVYPYSAGRELGTIDTTLEPEDEYVQLMGHSAQDGSMSLSGSSSIVASSATDVMAYGFVSATYGNDGGLVDEVFDQGDTLDQIAGDMSQIVEDMQAKQDTANDIGGATTQDQIDNASATVTTGTAAINDFSNTALGSVQSHVGIFNGYAGLIGNALTIMGNFGTGALGTSWLLLVTVMIAMIAIKYALKSGG